MIGERDKDVAVPAAQPMGATVVRGDELGLAEAPQDESSGGVGTERGVGTAAAAWQGGGPQRPGRLQPSQFRLGHPRRSTDQRQALRRGDIRPSGDVDEAEDELRRRVVDGGGGATPRLDKAVEVFLGAHMGRGVQVKRHARSIGAGMVLVPDGALDEVDRFGLTQDGRRSGNPQQRPVGITDGHDAVTVDGGPAEDVVQQGEDRSQRMGGPIGRHLGTVHPDGCQVTVRVDTAGAGTHPGVGHDTANAVGGAPRCEEGVALRG